LELEHANVVAGFPSPADDYTHETLDFNRDYIRHPEASFYGDVEGDSMKDAGIIYIGVYTKKYTKVWWFGIKYVPLCQKPDILSYDSIDNERFQKQPCKLV